ncbi:MAG TPA: hypothetical protein VM782_18195, partial [Stellaceae bacterium]|nr:hypothetical protein [Stellaceae bacterium]
MPDSTTFLFDPTFSRAAVERGSGLPPRMLPQETAAPVSRSSAGANSTAGTQRTDLRWRDIQWVDFTSDPERGDLVPTSEQPRVWNLPQIIEPEPIAAELRAVLRH